jgi:hypothetical protein
VLARPRGYDDVCRASGVKTAFEIRTHHKDLHRKKHNESTGNVVLCKGMPFYLQENTRMIE